jgi:hypothetical protein
VILDSTPPRPLRSSLAEGPIRDLGGWQTAVRESAPGLRSEAKGERALWVLAVIVGALAILVVVAIAVLGVLLIAENGATMVHGWAAWACWCWSAETSLLYRRP